MASLTGGSLLLLLSLLVGSSWAALIPSETFAGSASLVDNDVYHLFWKYNSTTITFEVHAKVLGWVGFGISPNGGMAGSDIVIGWVKDGIPYFHDRYATGDTMPTIDTNQDWTLLSASETATHTVLKFTRPLSLCDADDRSITAGTMRIIYAYSNTDPSSMNRVTYHNTNRGAKSMMFLTLSSETAPSLPADAFYVDYLNPNVTIPQSSDTMYWCQGFNVANMTGKHHLIRVDPVLQSGSGLHVHHIILYACFHTPENITTSNDTFVCYTPDVTWGECNAPIIAWGIGGGSFNFPAHAGMPFGDVATNKVRYLRMETHYDNPSAAQGVKDCSGLRLWFTPTLRRYDAGLLQAGITVNPLGHLLPGGYSSLITQGHCTSDCLTEAMGTRSEIKIFASGLHTHLLGIAVRVHHYRNGIEQPYIDEDLTYDFNYQEYRTVNPEVTISKGDNLVVECTYKTSAKTKVTYAGLGTANEMCLAFLYYYPAINVTRCSSVPTQPSMASRMSLNHVPYDTAHGQIALLTDHSNTPFHTYLETLGPFNNQTTRDTYQSVILNGQIQELCCLEKTVGLSVDGRISTVPNITSAYSSPCLCGDCSGAANITSSSGAANITSSSRAPNITSCSCTTNIRSISRAANITSSSLAVLGLLSMLLIMTSNL